jgi:hypothetical protein
MKLHYLSGFGAVDDANHEEKVAADNIVPDGNVIEEAGEEHA